MVMVLTIGVFAGGIYLLLSILHAWLRFKSGSRETDGLTNLWQESLIQSRSQKKENDPPQAP
ncbi:MAG: hypothetical protein HZB24_10645 [Desulfobacterales bacterium]|nr:hypothetical protein [Desulfobacterales bacterium]